MRVLDWGKSITENVAWTSREMKAAKGVWEASRLLRDDMPPEQIESAVRLALESAALLEENGDTTGQVAALRIAARGLQMSGRFIESLGPAERAVDIATRAKNAEMAMFSLGTLAISKLSLGDSRAALELSAHALEIGKQLGPQVEAACAIEMGQMCAKVGNILRAVSLLSAALPTLRESDDRSAGLLAAGYQCYGQSLAMVGEVVKALAAFQTSADIARRHGRLRIYALSQVGVGGMLFLAQGENQKALEVFRTATETLKASQRTISGLSGALLGMGMIEWAGGKFGAAQTAFEESLVVARDAGEAWAEAEATTALGGLYCCAERFDVAEGLLRRAVDLRENLRSQSVNDDAFRISIADTFGAEYGYLQTILQARGDAYGALEFSERARARALSDALTVPDENAFFHLASPEFREEIAKFAAETKTTFVEYSLVSLLDTQAALEGRARGIPLSQNLLIYVVQPNGAATALRAETKDFHAQVIRLLGVPVDSQPDPVTTSETRSLNWSSCSGEETNEAWLRLLHKSLIEPIAALLPSSPEDTIVLLPHEDIFSVPFAALPDASGKRLIEQHTLLTAPSIHTHIRFHCRKNESGYRHNYPALVLGNPIMPTSLPDGRQIELAQLHYAEKEAVSVAKLYGVDALTGIQATKAQLLRQMADSKIVHIATHGLQDDAGGAERPGAIVLTSGEGDSGLLTCEELVQLRLHCDLVVLSACQTGRGRVTSDGVVGLSRTLLVAGVRTVVVALSKVRDDSTAYLMESFHQEYRLNKKGDVAASLRKAMLATRNAYNSPPLWGSFMIMGARYSCEP